MKLYYRQISSGYNDENKRAPIIFLHAMVFSGQIFQLVTPEICKKTKRKVYILDARNHGKSPWSDEMTYEAMTNDLLEFFDQHQIQKAVIVGSSMGGRTAMNFALKYPAKVDALIVEDMTPQNVPSSGTNVSTTIISVLRGILASCQHMKNLDEVRRTLVKDILETMHPTLVEKERILKRIDHMDLDFVPVIRGDNGYIAECNDPVVVTMFDNDALVQNLPELGITFNGDALFLYGSKGFFNLHKDESLKKLFPKAVVKRIEGGSHFTHVDSAEEYIHLVSHFINHRNLPDSKL